MFIFSNLAISLDGKINTADRNRLFHLGSEEDRRRMRLRRQECDAVLMGASTLRAFKKPCFAWGGGRREDLVEPVNVVLSSRLQGIDPDWPFFRSDDIRRILLVGEKVSARRVESFADRSRVVVLGKPTARLPMGRRIVKALEQEGIERLLVEGGGEVMWHFVRENLIDEYHVTLTPRLLGGAEAPTLVDGEGFLPKESLQLRLVQCEVRGDELFLIYRKR